MADVIINNISDEVKKQKLDSYRYGELENFAVNEELTVTISLYEYRELIKSKAVSDYRVDKLKNEKRDMESHIKSLENTINVLRENLDKPSEEGVII